MPVATQHPSVTELLAREAHHAKLEAKALRKKAADTARFHNEVRRRILDKVAVLRAGRGSR
jgi:hypothetical protein